MKIILVTGMHRSGTTILGDIIAAHKNAVVLHEPSNNSSGVDAIIRYSRGWYQVNMHAYKNWLERVGSSGGKSLLFTRYYSKIFSFRGSKCVVKDPFISISYQKINVFEEVYVIIRHPASIYASCKNLGWDFSFVVELSGRDDGDVRNFIWFWNYVYSRDHSSSIIVRQEDLANGHFSIDIDLEKVQKSRSSNIHRMNRSGLQSFSIWKSRLDRGVQDLILNGCWEVGSQFYSKEEWFNLF